MFEPRKYQADAVRLAVNGLQEEGSSLWQMPTGSGKAYSIALLINEMLDKCRRILVLVDQKNLVEQLYGTIALTCRSVRVGIACKGLAGKIDAGARVVVASRQTLAANQDVLYSGFDFVILDEAHEVKPMRMENGTLVCEGQYYDIISTIKDNANGELKLHGCTATPWRLNDGYIFGTNCKPGNVNYFKSLTYKVTYREMIAGGFVVPPVYMREERYIDRESLKIDPLTGEYDERSVSAIMMGKIGESVWLYRKHLSGLKYSAAFCCDIAHCEDFCSALKEKGFTSYAMHSKTKEDVLAEYKKTGGCLVTVDQATKGFDFPPLAGALMLRPTNASAICYQQIGRPLRAFGGKKMAVIVDPCGNTAEHMFENDLDRPVVPFKRRTCLGGNDGDKPITFKRLSLRAKGEISANMAEKQTGMAVYGHASTVKVVSAGQCGMEFIARAGVHGDCNWLRVKSSGGRVYNVPLHFLSTGGSAAELQRTADMCRMIGAAGAVSPETFAMMFPAVKKGIAALELAINGRDVYIQKVTANESGRD